MEIHAPYVSRTREQIEWEMEGLLNSWAEVYPEKSRAFIEAVKRRREALYNSSGMSLGGEFLEKLCIPGMVYDKFCSYFGQEWLNNPTYLGAFYKVAKCFMINLNQNASVPQRSRGYPEETVPECQQDLGGFLRAQLPPL